MELTIYVHMMIVTFLFVMGYRYRQGNITLADIFCSLVASLFWPPFLCIVTLFFLFWESNKVIIYKRKV